MRNESRTPQFGIVGLTEAEQRRVRGGWGSSSLRSALTSYRSSLNSGYSTPLQAYQTSGIGYVNTSDGGGIII